MSTTKRFHQRRRRTGRRQHQHHDRRPARPGAIAGHLADREAGAFRPRGDPRAPHACQGLGRPRHLHRDARHHALYEGEDLFRDRQADADVRPLLDRCRRAWCRRRRARYPRHRAQVLHRGRQLGHRRQQYAGVLLPRSVALSRSQPRDQARPAHRDAQRRQQLGFLDLAARKRCTRSRSSCPTAASRRASAICTSSAATPFR